MVKVKTKTKKAQLIERNARKAARKIVDVIHDAKIDIILLGGNSSRPAFSLVAEAWRKRYPGKPRPPHLPLGLAKLQHVKGKNVAIFEEVAVSGNSLVTKAQQIAVLRPKTVHKLALLRPTGITPLVNLGIVVGSTAKYFENEFGINYRNYLLDAVKKRALLRAMIDSPEKQSQLRLNKSELKRQLELLREKREELRQIASKIKPR